MTIETLVSTEIEPARSLAPVKDAAPDSNLAAAQFEAIIRAWKGEAVGLEGAIPMSPVGDADLDGSLFLGKLDAEEIRAACNTSLVSWMICSWDCPSQGGTACVARAEVYIINGCCSVGL